MHTRTHTHTHTHTHTYTHTHTHTHTRTHTHAHMQEFEYWLKRNPKILDSLLSFNTKECTLGPLIMSPSEQQLSRKKEESLTVTMEPSSPTLFQLGSPDDVVDGDDDLIGQEKDTTDITQKEDHVPPPYDDFVATNDEEVPTEDEVDQEEMPTDSKDRDVLDKELTTPTDHAGSIMHEESGLSIDMSCVPRVTSTDKLGPASPVLPTTTMESVVMAIEEEQGITVERLEVEGDSQSFGSDELATEAEQELDSSSVVQLAPSISDSLPDDEGGLLEGEG